LAAGLDGTILPAGLSRRSAILGLAAAIGTARRAAAAGTSDDDLGLIGSLDFHIVREGETLLDLARGHRLGMIEILAANPGVDLWVPRRGTPIILPTAHVLPDAPRRGVVVNLADLRLYAFGVDDGATASFPIGVGRQGFTTPLGSTTVVRKAENPTWYPTEQTLADNPGMPTAIGPGPDNPMGAFALYLGWEQYAVHGTNRPWGVGRLVSRGCIRLYPEDIAWLYPRVPVGTPVTVVDQPVKLAHHAGMLLLEVHPSRGQYERYEATGTLTPEPLAGVEQLVRRAAPPGSRIDWSVVRRAARERTGVPERIG
jgi:L,D-transpeptidase ErfK/SrfK